MSATLSPPPERETHDRGSQDAAGVGPPQSRASAVRPRSPGVTFRKWNRLIHRDIGYLAAGLTVIYAISGVAVNHARDWNPNFQITHETAVLGLTPGADFTSAAGQAGVVGLAVDRFAPGTPVRGTFQPDPETLRIFVEDGTIEVSLLTGEAILEVVKRRPILGPLNFLHLNTPRALWTWVADLFAIALALLAISGLFMIRGKNSLMGRGKWLTAAGVLIPLGFLLLYL